MVQKKIGGLFFLLVVLLFLSHPNVAVFASTLTINNHVIYQEREGIEDRSVPQRL